MKLPLGLIGGNRRVDAGDSVQNEWLCAKIVEAIGLPVASTEIGKFADHMVLVVERFDRQWVEGDEWIARLPQEDFCQALGYSPNKKYEQHGGPGMKECLGLLSGSVDKGDKAYFLLTQLVFFLLAATDGHAKNFSIHLHADDQYEMTPLYDILSMWPYFGDGNNQFRQRSAGLAMAIRSKSAHYHFYTIEARHWYQLAMKNGGAPVWEIMLAIIFGVDDALSKVERQLPHDFPAQTWEKISQGMRSERDRFTARLKAIA